MSGIGGGGLVGKDVLNMKKLISGAAILAGIVPQMANALPLVDDFAGGPHTVSLTSFAPPEINTGSFAYAGAVGGVRDVFVISSTVGIFSSGVAFGSGGYASFSGSGSGGIIWDGVGGAVDKNSDGAITLADDFDFGLDLDFVENCSNPQLHLNAFADLAGGSVNVMLANSATEYGLYTISLTTVGSFDDYFVPVLTPTFATGGYDPTSVAAVALLVDGSAIPDLDVRVQLLEGYCPPIPEPGTWVTLGGMAGVIGLTVRRARMAKA